jgi:hypothetical protein
MTEEEKIAALWEIAQEVASEEPTYETGFGCVECIYCNGNPYGYGGFVHEPTCIVTKARALVKEVAG